MKITNIANDAIRKSPMDPEVKRLADLLFLETDIPTIEDILMGIGQQGRLNSVEQEPKNYPVSSGPHTDFHE